MPVKVGSGMSIEEMDELLELKGWNDAILAGNLHMTQAGVVKWRQRREIPDGPAAVLMQFWLTQCRKRVART